MMDPYLGQFWLNIAMIVLFVCAALLLSSPTP